MTNKKIPPEVARPHVAAVVTGKQQLHTSSHPLYLQGGRL
jgi:hypothetical protein